MFVYLILHKIKLNMKKIIFSALAALAFVGVSCSSDDNSSDNGNGITPPNKKIKVIERININSVYTSDYSENNKPEYSEGVVELKYNAQSKVESIVDGTEVIYNFIYDDKGVVKEIEYFEPVYVPGEGEKIEKRKQVVSEFLGLAPFNFGKLGKINTLDKGNPVDLTFYSFNDQDKVEGEYKTEIKYDNKPFAAFHTLNTTGAIDLSKKTQVDFGPNKAAITGLKYANELLPMNNPTSLKHAYVGGKEYSESKITYQYDGDQYPISFEYEVKDYYKGYDGWDPVKKEEKYKWITDITKGKATITYKEMK